MKAQWVTFGELKIEGQPYNYDVIIQAGRVSKRGKKASEPYRNRYGHTPLSIEEPIPWGGKRLIIGTGAYGRLPIMPEVYEEAHRRGVEIVAVPTPEACKLLHDVDREEVYAILHVTC